MLDLLNKNKTTFIGILVLIVAAWGYFTFFGGGPSSAPLTAVSSDSALGGNLLSTLNSLHTIKLDDRIFTDPVFLSLSDFGTTLPTQPAGRGNPFAPIGASVTGSSQSSSPTIPVAPRTSTKK